ncbi:hypothetical protein [Streptomyces mirabilis]|uniref:hypothetical protein n=1 Tax=Streptomyces mirabilis TaxID=68239 RepID=UPI00224E53BE|nr:hypothetical protein [Streptomyces mirabilis]MCX4435899.1 hypothetical protein [Streptomyces mirabilis]
MVLGLFCGAGWTFLNKGLYLLPGKMCEGTLERGMVKSVLPSARSADSGSHNQGAGYDLTFWCHVTTTNDSSISGEARVQPTSREKWLAYYRGSGSQNRIIRVSVGEIEALAQVDPDADTSSVYVPCAPPGVPSYNASQPYAVVGEARTHGPAKATGVPLRQALTDFAYQLAKHAYKLAECKDPRDFPKELPRYENAR